MNSGKKYPSERHDRQPWLSLQTAILPHDKSANVFWPPEASNLNHTAAVNDCCAGSRVALSGSGEARNALDEKRRAALGVPKRSGTQLRPGSELEEKTLYVSALSKEKKKVVSAGPSTDDGMHVT